MPKASSPSPDTPASAITASTDIAAFTQTLAGTSGYVERWQYGESLHFTDFNGDGRVDLCGARGAGEGQLQIGCFLQKSKGTFPAAADFLHGFLDTTQWAGDWSYGEDLSFVQP